MRLPWASRDDSEPEPSGWDDEPEGGEGGGEPEPEVPTLDELDDDAKVIAERYAQAQVASERKEREKLVASARERGYDYAPDGALTVRDMRQAVSFLAPAD